MLDARFAPVTCGKLTIKYPFWLPGRQPSYYGYPTFGVTYDNDPTFATPSRLNDSYLCVLDIHYGNSSIVAFHANMVGSDACRATRFNMSTSLALSLSLLAVNHADWELFCVNCTLMRPAGSLPLNCKCFGGGAWFMSLNRRFDPSGPAPPPTKTSSYCGYPTFGVTCNDQDLTFVTPPRLNDSYLRVLYIHYDNSSIVAFHANMVGNNACYAT
ncbi:hypothetical protein GUJ93_ZPchr0001g31216 [Zizania palustris]|uniref:Wall-associated receptor kinase galacturonan-binding domain-containing protein n=1 Tax=Zizania palustris TaxID=103762 RepID=A0A8J5RU19_ZIZPA|nr:hypothetical protein GUJ93_ZPchr0001g31216 [Zizania palustris]